MTIELLPEHLSKLDEMSALLRISQDCTIAFVRCNEPVLRDAVNAEIKKIVSDEVFIYDIKIDENSYNLLSLLNEAVSSDLYALQIKQNKKLAFFVFGLDKAIEKKNPDGKSEALVVLNMMREEFLKIKHVIIIWINSASLSLILKDAQDFFSWRTTVFEFDMPRMEAQKRSVEFEDTEFWSLTKKELEERWESYYGLLKEYREKRIEDAHKFAYWNYNLGMIRLLHGHAAEAQKFFEDSLNFSEKIMDKRGVEDSSGRLGQTYHVLGQVEKAIQYHEKALVIAADIGNRSGEGYQRMYLGYGYNLLNQTEKSIENYKQALAIAVEIGDRRGEGNHLNNIGFAFENEKKYMEALACYLLAREIYTQINDPNLRTTESNLNSLKEKLGEKKFEKLMAKTAPGAQEIVRKILEGASD
jgi:G-protein signaling modulator 2